MKKLSLAFLLFSTLLFFQSCKKENKGDYNVPTTYNFDNVDYSGQTTRIAMLTELGNEMKKGNTPGTVVDAQVLKNMYANTGAPFSDPALNTSGKQLKDKTFASERTVIEGYMDLHAQISQSTQPGSNGVAGVVTSGAKAYLCDSNGIEYIQFVEKGLLGAVLYYQITAVYLSEDKIGPQVALADRQHHWDEAFGYFGVPVDFPANTTGLKFIGRYCNDRNALLGLNSIIMNAYLKGRAAINNNDNETVTTQVAILRDNLEKVMAATAIKYINGALANPGDDAIRNHELSEGITFIRSLRFNPTRKITDTQIAQLEGYFGNNFYTVNLNNLAMAKNLLSSIYGFDNVKDQL